MAGKYPDNTQQVGRLVDLGVIALTSNAIPVPSTLVSMAVSIQAESGNAGDVLVGDANNQSRRLAALDVYTVQVGTPGNVYMRVPLGETGSVNVHLVVPPGA